jgi:hypothetical protein
MQCIKKVQRRILLMGVMKCRTGIYIFMDFKNPKTIRKWIEGNESVVPASFCLRG